jgi:dolichol-phosphate mannosyltransferase
MLEGTTVAVVIPCYRAANSILDVLQSIPEFVDHIFVVDDACPDKSGQVVKSKSMDSRINVLTHNSNQGVGGAVVTGYKAALENTDAQVIAKMDADGQMDPSNIVHLIRPLLLKEADYAKGTRFDSLEDIEQMPKLRILGNAVLSLMSKFSTGYWDINDPTNGFTAISRTALQGIALSKLRRSFFFESDMLFRLALVRAVVVDVPMSALYASERSNLRIRRVLVEFPHRHNVNFLKRIFYNYYLREWNVGSLELPIGLILMGFGVLFGVSTWASSSALGVSATSGQALLAAVPIILGFQLFLAFLTYDISAVPRRVKNRR